MTTSDALLRTLCGGAPDGRPLYAFRISDPDYERLRQHLQDVLRTADPARLSSTCCALFCLFVAEQSRRDPEQAGQRWAPVHNELGTQGVAWSHVTTWVVRGLRVLQRTVLRTEHSRLFRVTLGCEGGLALERLGAGEKQGSLRSYFRALLTRMASMDRRGDEHDVLREDAERVGDRLPKRYRNEVVYTLAGELAGAVWSFRRAVRGADDPVAALDASIPTWRDQLPLVLSGSAADAFVRHLIVDVETLAAGAGFDMEVVAELMLGERPHLVRRLRAPRELTDPQVRTTFPELPENLGTNRFSVVVATAAGDRSRVGTLRENSDSSWTFRPQTDQAPPEDEGGTVRVELRSRQTEPVVAVDLGGCDELGPLPWVFKDEPRGQLIGVGSVRNGADSLIVAVPTECVVDGDVDRLPGSAAGRQLFRVRGQVRVELDQDTVSIRTAEPAEAELFELRGRTLQDLRAARPIWLGVPRLYRRSLSATQPVAATVKLVRGQLTPPAGDVELRYVDEQGELRFKRRILVVPPDTRIDVARVGSEGRPGTLRVSATGLREVAAPLTNGVDEAWVGDGEGHHLVHFASHQSGHPTRGPLTLDFQHATLTGSVVLPLRTLRFEDLDGNELENGCTIHLRHLQRYRAVGLSPRTHPRLQAVVEVVGVSPRTRPRTQDLRPAHRGGPHILSLGDLDQLVRDLLHQAGTLDAEVRIMLEAHGEPTGRPVRLHVKRYDWQVDVNRSSGDVALLEPLDEGALAHVSVEVRSFSDIARAETLPRLRSARVERPTWTFTPEDHPAGAYLMLVSDAGWYRCRPTVLLGAGPGVVPTEGLTAAFQAHPEEVRHRAISDVIDAMKGDPTHPDWPLVHDYLALVGDIPPATFDLVRVIAADPAAAAVCAVRLATRDEDLFLLAWDGLEQLGLVWEEVRVTHWWAALDQLEDTLSTVPGEVRSQVVGRTIACIEQEMPAFRPITEALGGGLSVPAATAHFLLEQARSEARNRLADERWPRAPDDRFDVDPLWSSGTEAGHTDMRAGLVATAALAQTAVFQGELTPPQRLYLTELRALDSHFFQDTHLFATCAMLAAKTRNG